MDKFVWAAALGLALSGCTEIPTSVLVQITAVEVPRPDHLRVMVFADQGRVVDARVPDCRGEGDCSLELPNDLVLYPSQSDGTLRLLVRAKTTQETVGEGVAVVTLHTERQVRVSVILRPGLLKDSDGDGVPDEIDNCPAIPNPEQRECAGDAGVADGPRVDGAGLVDTAPGDIPTQDSTPELDTGPKDSSPKPDASMDMIPAPDSSPPSPCAQGSVALTYNANMVVCQGGASYDQCGAGQMCNMATGWSLCTANQFRNRGGAAKPAPMEAWLASCVRDGNGAVAPMQDVCSSCTVVMGVSQTVSWECTGGPLWTTAERYVGVLTYSLCRHLGVDDANNAAYWRPARVVHQLNAAVCCN
jgi:hypothetical protein